MTQSLRPMRLGEILDRTFHIYRAEFWIFVSLSLLPAAGMMLLQFLNLFWWKLEVPELIHILGINFGYIVYWVGEYHCSVFFHALVWPTLVIAASGVYLGEKPGVWSSVRVCSSRWASWIGLALLLQLLVIFLAEAAAIAVFLGVAALGDWLSRGDEAVMDPLLNVTLGLMVPAAFAFSLWLGTVYMAAVPAWCMEGLKLRKSFKRSRQLLHGSRSRAFCIRFVPVILALVLQIAAATSLRIGLIYASRAMHHPVLLYTRIFKSIYLVFGASISALITPLFPIALTLLYYDQRIRKEGFDIEWMMHSAGMTEPIPIPAPGLAQSRPEPAAPAPASVPVEEPSA
jgi:hypothetical protein